MARRSRDFSLFLSVLLAAFLCSTDVTGFGVSSPVSTYKRSSKTLSTLCALKPRATRTLYKPKGDESDGKLLDIEVLAIEREIQESTKARLDLQRVSELLEDDVEVEEMAATSDWQVSLAAGSVAAAVTLGTTDNWTLATFALVSVYVLANGDPLEEQTPAGEYTSLALFLVCSFVAYRSFLGNTGAAARVVGRATMHSLRALQPKMKAVARVAIRGDDQVALLTERIEQLEAENAQLRLWQKRRNAVDNSVSKYTLQQLKSKAREKKLPVGGSKATLLMRLVEAEAIDV